ncbi:hypothetical protein DRQ50_06055 [bacterium]|nr:MAG: hypothetical protein DRQ50_06055 [bacterium]
MALEGQLSDFNLGEILQLIASQQKSGFLHLETQREMVFVFDKGVLVSTRDRRSRSRDPLESYLRAYGFFDNDQWRHVEYVRKNASLDLTEILTSEGLFTDEELGRILRSVAQEMVVAGMKLSRGRYGFTPTKETPPGIRYPVHMDVQGLLMESVRRVDEEGLLREMLPSQAITFSQGATTLPAEDLGETGRRIMKLALAGLQLGRIIRQGKTESFVVRDLLKNWCDDGVLTKHDPETDELDDDTETREKRGHKLTTGLRSVPLAMLVICLLAVGFWGRWVALPATGENPGRTMREAQLRSEIIQGARIFRYEKGHWPSNLDELVRGGQLEASTLLTAEDLGWSYELDPGRDSFRLGT